MGQANVEHIARHDVRPDEAEQVLGNEPVEVESQIRSGEERVLYLGVTDEGRVLFVVVTQRAELVRVVTAHVANKRIRTAFWERRGTDAGN